MAKRVVFFLVVLSLSIGISKAQDTLWFDIKTRLFHVGDLEVVRNQFPDSVQFALKTKVHFLPGYAIEYLMQSTFVGEELQQSQAYIQVNKHYYYYCQVTRDSNFYQVKTLDDSLNTKSYPTINSGITPLYFEFDPPDDSIFSEYCGSYKPFIKKNNFTYLLADKEHPMEFFAEDSRLVKVTVPNNIMDFFIVLRKETR